ncbi:MAG: hypothetical protein WBC04_19570 [Candidatus Acidiferrales bacterium]
MGKWRGVLFTAALAALLPGIARAQTSPATPATAPTTTPATGPVTTVDEAIDRILAREHRQMDTIRRYSPLIETYIQDMRMEKGKEDLGVTPVHDHYFIGQADLTKKIVDRSMVANRHGVKDKLNPLARLGDLLSSEYVPEGFLQMIYLDTAGFDREHYHFEYVRREFLGEVRCLVFDVTPLPKAGKGRFKGRIWAEDQDYTIVRFNGMYAGTANMSDRAVHFDSWRVNAQPGLWLPAYIFSQETDPHGYSGNRIKFRGQTRLWGYNLKNAGHESEFSDIKIESPNIQDRSAGPQDPTPVEAKRSWQQQAEQNVVERLERSGLIAPRGEVDKVLETVVNNIQVTNNLDFQPEVHCRVFLTSTLESFSIGHTIVMSRGLLDTLPDEASLAAMLTQELANIMLLKTDTDRWGFNDETIVSTVDALRHFSFQDNPHDLQAATQKAVELLKNSPYKDKLATAGLFLKQLDESSKSLSALISPKLGNRVMFATQLETSAPQLQPANLDQIAALPLGARIKLNPYSDRVDLIKSKPVRLLSEREKMPFEVTPFMPYLTRYSQPNN